nr:ribonuclease H-like domain-containing protein [Tanacetum cinerariifolium]
MPSRGGNLIILSLGYDVGGSSKRVQDDGDDDDMSDQYVRVRNKMHKAFPLLTMKFPLPEQLPTAIPANTTDTTNSDKSGRMLTLTAEDMQRKKNDVKARTTLLLSLPDENQLRFSKYKTAKELWDAILKTFGGNEATKKTKKNLLKQQYGNFKAECSETLEQTFNRLQVIVGQLQSDLDNMSLDDLYNHLKVYESEVQKKPESNADIKWNMALLSMRADKFWKKTGKKISIQGSDVAGFDKLKVECFNCHKMGHFARECRASRSQDRRRRDNFRQGSKAEEQAPKALMAIHGVGWD